MRGNPMIRRLLVFAILCGACGGGGNDFNGTMGGHSFAVAEASSGELLASRNGGPQVALKAISLTNVAGVCARAISGQGSPGAGAVTFMFGDYLGASDTIAASAATGEFTIDLMAP